MSLPTYYYTAKRKPWLADADSFGRVMAAIGYNCPFDLEPWERVANHPDIYTIWAPPLLTAKAGGELPLGVTQAAAEFNVRCDRKLQERNQGRLPLHQFTDNETGSTFYLPPESLTREGLMEAVKIERAKFKPCPDKVQRVAEETRKEITVPMVSTLVVTLRLLARNWKSENGDYPESKDDCATELIDVLNAHFPASQPD